ncbi:hypothetical protein [Methanosalsum natronophilum]|uniref:hypothetical protein n=1 Tax=Methanosalsum natronophilum TaxID=768733 RepID=UPI0021680E60|nr:hypothetical protein [Methanosalsum natronophilum]MCS3924907.1 hypothetical protein [Methanosalsum natronophilum]
MELSNHHILGIQKQFLDTLQQKYSNKPILIKAIEGPMPKGQDPDLYKWTFYKDIWSKVKYPIYTRLIMPNELFIDPDQKDWGLMKQSVEKLRKYCLGNNIPIFEFAFSGGKGVHVSIIFNSFNVDTELKDRLDELNIDIMQVMRQTIITMLLEDADIDFEDLGLDWLKINFSALNKGSMVRCFGALRNNGQYKTQLTDLSIPNTPSDTFRLPLKIPERIDGWDLPKKYQSAIVLEFENECSRVIRAQKHAYDNKDINAELFDFPCIQYIDTNIEHMNTKRYNAARGIVLLNKKLGKNREETQQVTNFILAKCKYWHSREECKHYVSNATNAFDYDYTFSCKQMRLVVGTGGCEKSRCPLSVKKLERENVSKTVVTQEYWPPCINQLLLKRHGELNDIKCLLLSSFIGQMGWEYENGFQLFRQVCNDRSKFDSGFTRYKTMSCKQIRHNLRHICTPDIKCMLGSSPRQITLAFQSWEDRAAISSTKNMGIII